MDEQNHTEQHLGDLKLQFCDPSWFAGDMWSNAATFNHRQVIFRRGVLDLWLLGTRTAPPGRWHRRKLRSPLARRCSPKWGPRYTAMWNNGLFGNLSEFLRSEDTVCFPPPLFWTSICNACHHMQTPGLWFVFPNTFSEQFGNFSSLNFHVVHFDSLRWNKRVTLKLHLSMA